MTKDEIIVSIYFNKKIIAYCRSICSDDYEELKSQLIIQLYNMNETKLKAAWNNKFIEYLCFTICKRIIMGRVKGSGDFYLKKAQFSIEEGFGLDIAEEAEWDNSKLEAIETALRTTHWYNKTLFDYYYKDGYKLREIEKITGINLKSINYTINKTKLEIKNKLKNL